MRGAVVLLSLAFLLAGCSGDGGGDGSAGGSVSAPSTSATSTGPAPPPVPRTDTLHFLLAPAMTPVPPTGSDERSPVLTGFNGPGGGQQETGASWSYQVTERTNVTAGEVRVWVEIKEQMLPSVFGNPFDPPCTWELTTTLGAGGAEIENCLNEPPGPIAPGIKELVFTLVLESPSGLEPGQTITVTLERTAFSASPNNAVDALSGSAEHDSRIRLAGLKEPVVA